MDKWVKVAAFAITLGLVGFSQYSVAGQTFSPANNSTLKVKKEDTKETLKRLSLSGIKCIKVGPKSINCVKAKPEMGSKCTALKLVTNKNGEKEVDVVTVPCNYIKKGV